MKKKQHLLRQMATLRPDLSDSALSREVVEQVLEEAASRPPLTSDQGEAFSAPRRKYYSTKRVSANKTPGCANKP